MSNNNIEFVEEMIEQIEACKFSCEAGQLESNTGYLELKERALYMQTILGWGK